MTIPMLSMSALIGGKKYLSSGPSLLKLRLNAGILAPIFKGAAYATEGRTVGYYREKDELLRSSLEVPCPKE